MLTQNINIPKATQFRSSSNTPSVIQHSTEFTLADCDFSPRTLSKIQQQCLNTRPPLFSNPPISFRPKNAYSPSNFIPRINLSSKEIRPKTQSRIQSDSSNIEQTKKAIKPVIMNSPFEIKKISNVGSTKNIGKNTRPQTTLNVLRKNSVSSTDSYGFSSSLISSYRKGSIPLSYRPNSKNSSNMQEKIIAPRQKYEKLLISNPIDIIKDRGKLKQKHQNIDDMLRFRIAENGDTNTPKMKLVSRIGNLLRSRDIVGNLKKVKPQKRNAASLERIEYFYKCYQKNA